MTFSIIVLDPVSGDLGIAVASKILAVGSFVPYAAANIGAVATQSFANLNYASEGLQLMAKGYSPEVIIPYVTGKDPEAGIRQVAMINARGEVSGFTGENCVPWAGHFIGNGFSVQGNMLTGENVIKQMVLAWDTVNRMNLTFSEKLLAVLEAGEAVGGDKRGRQSAALLVVRRNGGYGGQNDRLVDLRVDNSQNPLQELRAALNYKLEHGW